MGSGLELRLELVSVLVSQSALEWQSGSVLASVLGLVSALGSVLALASESRLVWVLESELQSLQHCYMPMSQRCLSPEHGNNNAGPRQPSNLGNSWYSRPSSQ